jgi:tetratricopeptide (TPR) repeat protein
MGQRRSTAARLALLGLAACAPACSWIAPHRQAGERHDSVPLFDNLGSYSHPITTKSELAQRYFDQGLRLVYGFNHEEARRAFEEAARLDPDAVMAYWGIAYTLGPNYNLPGDPDRDREAYQAVAKAQARAGNATEHERAYLSAIATRYADPPPSDRRPLDEAYAQAMRGLSERFPDDLDGCTLYAESMMDLRPWDLWTHRGKPQPGTLEIVATLESVLRRNPEHPGANHYYIHAVEASSSPERGLASADRLADLVPGAGHLVHMPSHIYIRTGRYSDAVMANQRAVAVDEAYIASENVHGVYSMMYYPHNLHFLSAAAAFDGRSVESAQAADKLAEKVPLDMISSMPMLESLLSVPLLARVRFGKWDEILARPVPPEQLQYASAVSHYARGLAYLRTARPREAKAELAALDQIAAGMPKDRVTTQVNKGSTLLGIASHSLAGEIAATQAHTTGEAVTQLEEAVKLQDSLVYMEPPDWFIPVREALGAVLLRAKRAAEAEAVYRSDLKFNPENGWSLFGLAASLRAQKKTKEAAQVQSRFEAAWKHADVSLPASRF